MQLGDSSGCRSRLEYKCSGRWHSARTDILVRPFGKGPSNNTAEAPICWTCIVPTVLLSAPVCEPSGVHRLIMLVGVNKVINLVHSIQ